MKIELTDDHQLILCNLGNNETIVLPIVKIDHTIWMRQKQIEELFDVAQSVISRHIKNVFYEELDEKSIQFLQIENMNKPVAFYDLNVIISVGYKVNSERSFAFRRWANSVLKNSFLQKQSKFGL